MHSVDDKGIVRILFKTFLIKKIILSRHHSHINSAKKIIETASVGEPLVHQLKNFFANNKNIGSNDRKNIASLCYNYYRIGNALKNKTVEEKIITACFLCSNNNSDLLESLAPYLFENASLSLKEKCVLLKVKSDDIFLLQNELSESINAQEFSFSFLVQPLLYIRVRPGKQEIVNEKLATAKIDFSQKTDTCIALPQATKMKAFVSINNEVVVQDYSSQQVFNYLQNKDIELPTFPSIWDCCAASGGKSILINDLLGGKVDLHVSDVRASILNNLFVRFKEAGIKKYNSFITDLMLDEANKQEKKYDIIICDAPCSGSGTWSRTPEQLAFFDVKKINVFADMQKKIASNALRYLKENGLFFYITCSAFKKENEEVVHFLTKKFHLQIKQMEYYKGYEMQADTMFAAVLSFK